MFTESVTNYLKDRSQKNNKHLEIPKIMKYNDALEFLSHHPDVSKHFDDDNHIYHIGKYTRTVIKYNGYKFALIKFDSVNRSYLYFKTKDSIIKKMTVILP